MHKDVKACREALWHEFTAQLNEARLDLQLCLKLKRAICLVFQLAMRTAPPHEQHGETVAGVEFEELASVTIAVVEGSIAVAGDQDCDQGIRESCASVLDYYASIAAFEQSKWVCGKNTDILGKRVDWSRPKLLPGVVEHFDNVISATRSLLSSRKDKDQTMCQEMEVSLAGLMQKADCDAAKVSGGCKQEGSYWRATTMDPTVSDTDDITTVLTKDSSTLHEQSKNKF